MRADRPLEAKQQEIKQNFSSRMDHTRWHPIITHFKPAEDPTPTEQPVSSVCPKQMKYNKRERQQEEEREQGKDR